MRRSEVRALKVKAAEPVKDTKREEADGSVASRWPASTLERGEWLQVPRVLLRRLKHLKIDPRQLWLLLLLQSENYGNRKPRFYWEECADCCGKDKNTIRRWAYDLQKKGLLKIEECRRPDDNERPRPGYRNERNKFDLTPLSRKVELEQKAWIKERFERKGRKAVGGKV